MAAVASGIVAWMTYGELDKQRIIMSGQLRATDEQISDARSSSAAADSAAAIAKNEQDALILANQELATAAKNQAIAANRSIFLSNRAWVYPVTVSIKKFSDDKFNVMVLVNNSGREPATNIEDRIIAFPLVTLASDQKIYDLDNGNMAIGGAGPCVDKRPYTIGGNVFPGPTGGQVLNQKIPITQENQSSIVVEVCVKYNTLGKTHTIEICEFAIALDDQIKPVSIENAQFHMCSNHNQAD